MSIRLLPFLLKNLLRSKTRLVATVGGCAVAAFVVAFFLTAQFSLASLLLQEEGRVNLVVGQKDRFCPMSSRIPDSEAARIGDLPQVAEVMPVRLMMTNCQSATDVVVVHGIDKEAFVRFHDYQVAPEDLAAFRADTSGALVGRRIAARYGWKQGAEVTLAELGNIRFTIRGLYGADDAAREYLILVGRRFLQEASDDQGVSQLVFVRLRPGTDPAATSRAIDDLPFTVDTTTRREDLHRAANVDQLRDIARVGQSVVVVVILVILLAVGNAIAMATRERVREFGVLKTLGYPRRAIAFLVLGEGALQALVGSVLGCAAVYILVSARLVTAVSSCGLTVDFLAGPYVWGASLLAVTLAGATGSLLPAWSTARLPIVDALRRED